MGCGNGGLLSITILPVHKRHRGTFQTLAASAQLVAMGGVAAWMPTYFVRARHLRLQAMAGRRQDVGVPWLRRGAEDSRRGLV